VTQAPEQGGWLEAPWQTLVGALRNTTPEAAAEEHEALFHGVGKAEVFPYGSFYLAGFLNEKPLAALRTDLATLGLTRQANALETEDHIAYLLEVMRWLIAGDDVALCNLEQQRRFFRAHLQPWVERLCDAVQAHPRAVLWHAVAGFTREFMRVETQAFDMLET
jgi:TorA maturation chaperone TorD